MRESPARKAWDYLSFDDPEVRRQAAAFAHGLSEGSREIVLDEVDLVVEHGRRVLAIAAKATRRPSVEDVRGLRAFLRGSPQAAGLLVHRGSERRQMDRRIWAVPWTDLARGR